MANKSNPKGPLALLVHPKNCSDTNTTNLIIQARANEESTSTATHRMKYFDYDPTGPRLSSSRVTKKRKHRNQEQMHDAEQGQQLSASVSASVHYTEQDEQRLYHPRNGEFTLVFFCEMNCRNSLRVTMALAKFLHSVEKTKQDGDEYEYEYECKRPIQLICIPNDDIDLSKQGSHVNATEANIITHLYSNTEFWHMGFDHVNRSAIIA
jgi:hypothetical protein